MINDLKLEIIWLNRKESNFTLTISIGRKKKKKQKEVGTLNWSAHNDLVNAFKTVLI